MIIVPLSEVSDWYVQRPVLRAALGVMLLTLSNCMAQAQQLPVPEHSTKEAGQGELIPEADIAALETQLKQPRSVDGRLSVEDRRTLKNTVRKGQELIENYPDAPNRFRVMAAVFQCQKMHLALENTEINRKAVFETCERMAKAPDEYAVVRLDADLLLSEKEMSEKNANMEARAQALAGIIERYRGTTAESKSLLMAAMIVQQLDAPELESSIYNVLDERYADDHEVIEFRRDHLRVGRLSVGFEGDFEHVDGSAFSLPEAAFGHLSLMVFWSKDKPGVENLLATVRKYQEQYPDCFTVFSLNVDELQDAGQSFLSEKGYDWRVLRIPGGRTHPAYKTYAKGDAAAILVSEYGYTVLMPGYQSDEGGWRGERSGAFSIDAARISDARYTSQLQSLFIGDFLIWSDEGEWRVAGGSETNASSGLADIYNCFVPVPFRYRLTREEALANYTKAATLAADLLSRVKPTGKEGWSREHLGARDARIVALMGMSSLACEPKHLDEAVKDAKAGLGSGADVIPRFCLARALLRSSEDAETVVTGFLKDCGGDMAPASALAAAAILAIEARLRDLHDMYRAAFLDKHGDDPAFYALSSFLRDRYHWHRLLKPNHTLREDRARSYIVGYGYPSPTNKLPSIELRNLDGSELAMPRDTNGKLTYLLFVEPPDGGPTNDFPFATDRNGKPSRDDGIRTVMSYADDLTRKHVNKDINFVAAFLTDDPEHVKYLVQANGWECQAAMVPGGLRNPMVQRLGILSADRFPNVFVLRRDGSIAWSVSGLQYKNEFGYPYAVLVAMKAYIEMCEMESACTALEQGDCKEAARIFAGPFPAAADRYARHAPRCHGRALACMGLEEWGKALDAVDEAVMWHTRMHYRGREPRRVEEWPAILADFVVEPPCDVMAELWATKAAILERLDRKDEAAALRKQAAAPVQEDHENAQKQLHERLKVSRLKDKQEL